MTSEEIKAVRNQLIDDPRIDTNVAQAAALYEVAYQLAVANERAEAPKKKSQFWKCPSCAAMLTAAAPIERPQHTCGAWMDPL